MPRRSTPCIDCGASTTGVRCKKCNNAHRGVGKHSASRYNNHGCRCDVCSAAVRVVMRQSICIDCGDSCQRGKRCRACWLKDKRVPTPRCVCGREMNRESKMCIICHRRENHQQPERRREMQRAANRKDPRCKRAWRNLRQVVIDEEPDCRVRLPGCTGRSETADHIIPVSHRPDLAMVRENIRGSCLHCNRRRGNRLVKA